MIRPGRHAPAEHAGPPDAELQTDVMRFFALLAICLVALMSLAREPGPGQQTPAPTEPVSPARPAPVTPRPAPTPPQESAPTQSRASPTPPADPVEASQPTVPGPASPPEPGPLELRFASPFALARLETAGEIRVFAVAGGSGLRWSGSTGRFEPGRLPDALWLMEPSTVPATLRAALATAGENPESATWGVTLSPAIQARLQRRMNENPGGLLLIDAAGRGVPAGGSP